MLSAFPFLPLSSYGNFIKEIAVGGYGRVDLYLTTDNKYYVIKSAPNDEYGINKSLLKEIIYISRICDNNIDLMNCNENIIPILDVITTEADTKIVMPLAIGDLTSLKDISFEKKREIAYKICRGIYYIHSHNIIHGDIKPQNILLLGEELNPVIADFGLSQDFFSSYLNNVSYTLWYESIELLMGDKITFAADIWALGCTLIELFVGQAPFRMYDGQNQIFEIINSKGYPTKEEWPEFENLPDPDDANSILGAISQYPSWPRRLRSKLGDEKLYDLIMDMLEYNPERRITIDSILMHSFFGDIKLPVYPKLEQRLINRDTYAKSTYNGRQQINDLLMRTIKMLKMTPETIILTINYMDRLGNLTKISHLDLMGCVSLATKLHNQNEYKLSTLGKILNKSETEILNTTFKIAKELNYDLAPVTTINYLNFYGKYYSDKLRELTREILLILAVNNFPFKYSSRSLTLGAIMFVCNNIKEKYLHPSTDEIIDINNEINTLAKSSINLSLQNYLHANTLALFI